MKDNEIILYLVTKNYDAMKMFFADLGFDVPKPDEGWQICPAFNNGRGCVIQTESNLIGLEESTQTPASGPLYLLVGDVGVTRLPEIMSKYRVKELGTGIGGPPLFQVEPPDGGIVLFTAET